MVEPVNHGEKMENVRIKVYNEMSFSVEIIETEDSATKPEVLEDLSLPGLLYPRESESREVRSLDGMWNFAVSPSLDSSKGHREAWYGDDLFKSAEVMQMPVPSSYNDVTTSRALRDHVGVVWYERSFFVPSGWADQRVFLYFGSVNYFAQVWVNGLFVTNHEIGHLPFEAEVTRFLTLGAKNRITVAVDNNLSETSIPQGRIQEETRDNITVSLVQTYSFDFFNYAGIHRPVLLHTKPRVYIEDITVDTRVINDTGIVRYAVKASGLSENEIVDCSVMLKMADDTSTTEETIQGPTGSIRVPEAKLWWPRGMHPEPGYLYTLEVSVRVRTSTGPSDIYRLPVGIRSLRWTGKGVFINEKPIYLRGFGRHEDSPIRGRGLDLVTMTRDYELLKWIGANSYRTSHYPYSEEVLDMADRQGILIINECPAVNLENYSAKLLAHHKASLAELIRRDKNRPSVLMWSIANEPRSQEIGTESYFRTIADFTKKIDPTRPITAALSQPPFEDKAGGFLDVVGFNRYNSWYSETGRLEVVVDRVIGEAVAWNEKYKKPVVMFEYGADTLAGLHELPAYVWSEEYQTEMFSKHFQAFDRLRKAGFFIGEFIWNFADFRTAQSYTRVGGNKKGIFTRTREPKMVAGYVRRRYHALGIELDGSAAPNDLEPYVIGSRDSSREEL